MLLKVSDDKPSDETADSTTDYLEEFLSASIQAPLVLQYFAIITAATATYFILFLSSSIPKCCFIADMKANPITRWTKHY